VDLLEIIIYIKVTVINYIFYNGLSRREILFPVAEKVFKKATADEKSLKINSVL